MSKGCFARQIQRARSAVVGRIHRLVHTHTELAALGDVNDDQARLVASESFAEGGFEVLRAVYFTGRHAIALSDFDHIDSGEIHSRDVPADMGEIAKTLEGG